MGRISGWSLSMIEFEDDIRNNLLVGRYNLFHMPISGKYFVEIILVYCEGFAGDDWQSIDLRNRPLEIGESDRHQITAGNGTATIDIAVGATMTTSTSPATTTTTNTRFRGRWLHRGFVNSTLQQQQQEEQLEPLFTHYQPQESFCNKSRDFCQAVGPRRQALHDEYMFQWNLGGTDESLNQPGLSGMLPNQTQPLSLQPHVPNSTHVCFLGASHSRYMNAECRKVLDTTRKMARRQNLKSIPLDGFRCSHIYERYPKQIGLRSSDFLSKIDTTGCTHVVVGLFQWYFGPWNTAEPNITFRGWKHDLTKAVQILRNHTRLPSVRRMFLRSAHPNSFGWKYIGHPPIDYRTPVNARRATRIMYDIVNEELETTSNKNESKLPYISVMDTTSVMEPVWDSAKDYIHYTGHQAEAEVKFVLSTIMDLDELHF